MNGYIFYLEFPGPAEKRKSGKANTGHSGNCIAVPLEKKQPVFIPGSRVMECFSAVFHHVDSDCCGSQAHIDYLRENCKRVSESVARKIHPALFRYLEA